MVRITDTTFRDAHQSLMATRMRTKDMLPIAEKMDEIGFNSVEVWGGATFDVCIRFLNEDPWERLRALKGKFIKTPLQMLLRGQNIVGYRNYPDDVLEKFIERAAKNGIDIFRIFDALNDERNVEKAIKVVKKNRAHAQGTISYTTSPVHTLENYVKYARKLADFGCDSICIKDMSGIITPEDAYNLVKSLKKEIGLPVDLHSHSSTGMAPMAYFRACDAGVDVLDCAISPLSGGTSQPPVESIVAALQGTAHDTKLDLKKLVEIAGYFRKLRLDVIDPAGLIDPLSEKIDTDVLVHQVPGGMFSNLVSQLKEQNALDKLPKVLEEVPKVREDLGYPPLVTPTSQIVGVQAVANVLSGERYKMITKETKDYVKGFYGKAPAKIDSKLAEKILGSEKPITGRAADTLEPELNRIPEDVKPFIKSDEDLLTYVLFPRVAPSFFRNRGKPQAVPVAATIAAQAKAPPLGNRFKMKIGAKSYDVAVEEKAGGLSINLDGKPYNVELFSAESVGAPAQAQQAAQLAQTATAPQVPKALGAEEVKAPMTGKILSVKAKPGDSVRKGDVLFLLEAMKMENEIMAPRDCMVKSVDVASGADVSLGKILAVIE